MNRRHLLLLCAVALSAPLYPQTRTDRAEVQWGPQLNDKDDGNFQYVIATTDNAIHLRMDRKREQFIRKCDLDLRTVYERPIDKDLVDDDRSIERILLLDGRFLIFTQKYDKRTDRNILLARAHSAEDYSPLGARRQVAVIHAESARNTGSFRIEVSEDKKKVNITISEPWVKKEAGQNRTVTLDTELNEVENGMIEAKRTLPEHFVTDDRIYAQDGSLIYVGRKYPEKRERKALRRQERPDHTYCLVIFRPGSTTGEEHVIQPPGVFLQEMTFREDVNGDILCGGFYGKQASWSMQGVIFLRLDKRTHEVVHQSTQEFSADLITEGMSEKEERKAQKRADRKDEDVELTNYILDGIVRRDDGGAVLVAEQFRSYVVCTTDQRGNTRCSTHYVYNDIIVVNVDPDGNIDWAKKIVKRQHSVNDGGYFSGYAMHVKDDRMYFLFNDNGENLFLKPGGKVKQFELKGKDAMVTLVTIERDGALYREALFTQERKGDIFKPDECRSFPDDRMFMYATRGKNYHFGMLTFK